MTEQRSNIIDTLSTDSIAAYMWHVHGREVFRDEYGAYWWRVADDDPTYGWDCVPDEVFDAILDELGGSV